MEEKSRGTTGCLSPLLLFDVDEGPKATHQASMYVLHCILWSRGSPTLYKQLYYNCAPFAIHKKFSHTLACAEQRESLGQFFQENGALLVLNYTTIP